MEEFIYYYMYPLAACAGFNGVAMCMMPVSKLKVLLVATLSESMMLAMLTCATEVDRTAFLSLQG
jgi:hypothetical protein